MIIIGDLHGNFKRLLDFKNTNLIQVGDFGLGFTSFDRDRKQLDYYNIPFKARNVHVYAIRGNHDDPEYWDGRYENEWTNIHLVKDYTVLELEGKKYLFMGGAVSLDRVLRKQGVDWWKDEGFNYDEEKLEEVLKEHCPIDVVITHNCPEFAYPYGTRGDMVDHYCALDPNHLRLDLQAERSIISRAYDIISKHCKPEMWVYGHYHMNNTEIINGTKFVLLGIGEAINV